MIDKGLKIKILENIKDKDERIMISGILDKAIKFENNKAVILEDSCILCGHCVS